MSLRVQGHQRQTLIAYLGEISILGTRNGCESVLRNAGLGMLIPRISFASSVQLTLGNIVDYLAQYGTMEGEEALARFLTAVCGDVGEERQAWLTAWMQDVRVHSSAGVNTALPVHQAPTTGNVSIGGDVHGDVVMGSKSTHFDMRGAQIGTQVNVANGPASGGAPLGAVPASSELRARLQRFDSVQIESLCLDYFPAIYDQFSRGLRRDEMINLILSHCHRNPEDAARLWQVLNKR